MYIGDEMPQLVVVTGLLVAGVSLWLIAGPGSLAGLLERVYGSAWIFGAALLRLLLGAALIAAADSVRYSGVVAGCGWLFALSGLTLVAVPQPLLRRLAGWFGQLSPAPARLWLSGALAFGLFLVYAGLV